MIKVKPINLNQAGHELIMAWSPGPVPLLESYSSNLRDYNFLREVINLAGRLGSQSTIFSLEGIN